MTTLKIHPAVEIAYVRCEARYQVREETVDALNALTGIDWIVNAEEATRLVSNEPIWTHLSCANDSNHGRGTCAVEGSDDLLCPACAIDLIRPQLVENAVIAVEVLL